MRRHAKAPSAGPTTRQGGNLGRAVRGAFDTRGDSCDIAGSSAPSHRYVAILLAGLALLLFAPSASAGLVPGFGTVGSGQGNGEITSGSKVVNNVTKKNGKFVVGQTIAAVTGGGIPSNTTITAVGASTLELSANATATGSREIYASFNKGPKGLAVNTSGSGPSAGHVYVSDSTNNRVTEFTPDGEFLRAFGVDVVSAGPDNHTATSEVQSVEVPAAVTAGTFTLTYNGQTTSAIAFNAAAATVQAALRALTTIGATGVNVTGGPGATAPFTITFAGPLANSPVPQVTVDSSNLTGGSAVASTTTQGVSTFEICEAGVDTCKAGSSSSLAGGIAAGRGIAVDPATGNVFLASQSGERINVYSGSGSFEGAFGWKVSAANPQEELQFCTYASGCAAGKSGAGAGQFASMTGPVTIAAEPTVDPLNGDLFFADSGNRRVDDFALTLNGSDEVTGVSYVKGFGGDVIPTINEKQTIEISGASGGTFALLFEAKSTDATGSGDVVSGSSEVSNFSLAEGRFIAGEEISGPGIPAGTKILAVTFDSLTLSAAATATQSGASLSAALPYNPSAKNLEDALQVLPAIGSGNVKVSGSGPFTVEFQNALAGADVPQLEGDAANLTGPSPAVAVATTQRGANGTGTGYEVCTVATGCKAGEGEGDEGTFRKEAPVSVAIDSSGAIYATGDPGDGVTCTVGCRVQKFDPSVTSVEEFAGAQLSGSNSAVPSNVAPRRVAIDPSNDHVLVAKKDGRGTFKLYEFTKAGTLIDISPPGELDIKANGNGAAGSGPEGIAFGVGGRAYAASAEAGTAPIWILGEPPAGKASLDPVGEISQTTATFAGTAEPSAPGAEGGFPTAAWFEYSADGITWSSTEAVTIGDGSGAGSPNSCPTGNPPVCNVSTQAHDLQPGASYLVRMVVSNGTAATSATRSFETVGGPPAVTRMSSGPVGQSTATINGLVSPNNRSTTYHFEWGTTTAYGTRIPADFDVVAGSGSQPVPASASLSGLQPATTYHFRIVAQSAGGTTVGPDGEFTTLNSHGLPADRGIELVSPADKRPAGSALPFLGNQMPVQAAEDGESIVYQILNAVEGSTASGAVVYDAARSPSGWLSDQVTPPSLRPPPTNELFTDVTSAGQVRYGNPRNLNCVLVESQNPLTADTPAVDLANEVQNLYRWTRGGGYTLITTLVPTNPIAKPDSSGVYFKVQGANADCSRIFFRSQALTYLPGSSGLYEWDGGVLRDAGLLPNGLTPTGGVPDEILTDAVSPSGQLVFTAKSNQGADSGKQAVFVREGPGETVDASQPTTAVAPTGAGYDLAAANGSAVYFLANYGIAATSSSGATTDNCSDLGTSVSTKRCDLYRYDVASGELNDISTDTNPADEGQGATVQGVMAVSDDGSTAYFAARGQLIPGKGRTFKQNTSGEEYGNVYRWHEGQLSFVGTVAAANLSAEAAKKGGALARNPSFWTSQTTTDGSWFLYASDEITDANPVGAREAYLYSAENAETVCVSCPTDGSRPLLIQETFVSQVIAGFRSSVGFSTTHIPQSLSDDGRVFFTSPDKLAPGAVAGDVNIYEWHKGQLTLLISGEGRTTWFVDSGGPDGRDAFITSSERLNGADFDFAYDMYDFRSGGEFTEAPPAPVSCDPANGECQGQPSTAPSASSPATESFSGSANPPAPSKKHHKRHRKHHRGPHGKGSHHKRHGARRGKSHRAANVNRGGVK